MGEAELFFSILCSVYINIFLIPFSLPLSIKLIVSKYIVTHILSIKLIKAAFATPSLSRKKLSRKVFHLTTKRKSGKVSFKLAFSKKNSISSFLAVISVWILHNFTENWSFKDKEWEVFRYHFKFRKKLFIPFCW